MARYIGSYEQLDNPRSLKIAVYSLTADQFVQEISFNSISAARQYLADNAGDITSPINPALEDALKTQKAIWEMKDLQKHPILGQKLKDFAQSDPAKNFALTI